jgi:hypothetical protein
MVGPPPAGKSIVLIDADRPAEVDEVTGTVSGYAMGRRGYAYGIATRPICMTPCATHLDQGFHELVFRTDGGWGGTAQLTVGDQPTAFRYALGHSDAHLGARIGAATALSFGITSVAVGLPLWASSDGSVSNVGMYLSGGGAALTVLGAVLLAIYRGEYQPGTGMQWTLPSPGAPPGASP